MIYKKILTLLNQLIVYEEKNILSSMSISPSGLLLISNNKNCREQVFD